MSQQDERFSFIVEWYDGNACLHRKFQFFFFPKDNTIEMYDLKNRRSFLSRCKADNVRLEDMYVGASINILSRQLNFIEYGDQYTRNKLSVKKEKTFGLIKPDGIPQMGRIIDEIYRAGFIITKLKMCHMSRTEAMEFYEDQKNDPSYNELLSFISTGPVIAFELMGQGAVRQFQELLGPSNPGTAKVEAPMSIRAQFGTDNTRNACHGSNSVEAAGRELEYFFPTRGTPRQNTAVFTDCTCCVIKPHCMQNAGQIISAIQKMGFEVSAIQMFTLDRANVEEFYEIYKGVVNEYASMVDQLTSGPCIAMEIRAQNAPQTFREFVGPSDPEIARHLRPRTLRAQYGRTKIENAVHCTDLPEDGLLEVEYFFKILDQ